MNIEYMEAQCYGQFGELQIELSYMIMKTIKKYLASCDYVKQAVEDTG